MDNKILILQNIKKNFNDTKVLKGISLEVEKGEFITFLGSSGCGKTTTLRIIAGLEQPDEGCVYLEGIDVTNVEPHKRNVNTVFQNYALFPHMNIYDNVAYSLKIRGVDKKTIKQKVHNMLKLVQLEGYEKRMPSELSGGQKQRVAIARSVINNPSVLLLDEPLGALDLQLRRQMQRELKNLQKQLGITFVYITHDQEEAINMSDRIVVMQDGLFEQIGTPSDIYDRPRTSYVARFIGTANIIEGTVYDITDHMVQVSILDTIMEVKQETNTLHKGQKVKIVIRSENLILAKSKEGLSRLKVTVKENDFAGGVLRTVLLLENGQEIISIRQGMDIQVDINQTLYIGWKPQAAVFVDLEEFDEKEE